MSKPQLTKCGMANCRARLYQGFCQTCMAWITLNVDNEQPGFTVVLPKSRMISYEPIQSKNK